MSNLQSVNPPDDFFEMLEDLSVLATIPEDLLTKLARTLEEQSGFLTTEKLAELVTEAVPDETQGSAAFNAIQNLRAEAMPQLMEMLETWRNQDEANRRVLSDEQHAIVKKHLPILIREYPAIDRMQKAEWLKNVLGNEVKGLAFICDARPVYNKPQDDIEGFIPLATLKVVYERQNLDDEEIEFVLSESALEHLINEAKKAQQKLSVLKSRVDSWMPGGCVEVEE